jgi:glycosyltransferase involved in cell wall biosynthesis
MSESDQFETQTGQGCQSALAQPLFSVIIPVRNEEHNIARCLGSLKQMSFLSHAFEVVVVDNGSTDRTVEVASKFGECFTLRILERPGVYISTLRNAGASVARGQYLAFLDADCEVRADWLTQASGAASTVAGVFGAFYLIPVGSSWIARHWYADRESEAPGEVSYLPSGNLFVSSKLFHQIGGFDESIQTNEDYEFCQRAWAAGFPVTCLPELRVVHWGTPQTLSGFFRKNRWHGTHVFRVFVRDLPKLSNAKAVFFAIYTLLCLFGVVLGIGWLTVAKHPALLLLSLSALALPPLLLSGRLALRRRRWNVFLPLTILHITYGLARAASLLQAPYATHRH